MNAIIQSIQNLFLDLSKAFDTIDHSIFKFKSYHIVIRGFPLLQYDMIYHIVIRVINQSNEVPLRGTSLDWFDSFGKQHVTLNFAKFHYKTLSPVVPQGSVLAPTLFIFYINHMFKCSNKLKMVQFCR